MTQAERRAYEARIRAIQDAAVREQEAEEARARQEARRPETELDRLIREDAE